MQCELHRLNVCPELGCVGVEVAAFDSPSTRVHVGPLLSPVRLRPRLVPCSSSFETTRSLTSPAPTHPVPRHKARPRSIPPSVVLSSSSRTSQKLTNLSSVPDTEPLVVRHEAGLFTDGGLHAGVVPHTRFGQLHTCRRHHELFLLQDQVEHCMTCDFPSAFPRLVPLTPIIADILEPKCVADQERPRRTAAYAARAYAAKRWTYQE
jgi:hypothetical protein